MADVKATRKIWVQSNDSAIIEIDRQVAERSVLIKNLIEDIGDEGITAENPIPIPNVSLHLLAPSPSPPSSPPSRSFYRPIHTCFLVSPMLTRFVSPLQVNEAVLRKVIEWCEHHRNDPPQTQDDDNDARKKTTEIEEWDQKFMQVDQEMLFEIILVSPSLVSVLSNLSSPGACC